MGSIWAAMSAYWATAVVSTGLMMLTLATLARVTRRTHIEIARLLSTLRHHDWQQAFAPPYADAGYPELADAMNLLLADLRKTALAAAAESERALNTLQHVPTPLLRIADSGEIDLLNNAARRFFGNHKLSHLSDTSTFGKAFSQALQRVESDQLVLLQLPGEAPSYVKMTQGLLRDPRGPACRIVNLQTVQQTLDDAEATLKRDLVRVFTHEVMNSLTPVTSLAESARRQIDPETPSNAPLAAALSTLVRRADGLLEFVRRYREVTQTLSPQSASFPVLPWLAEVVAVARARFNTPALTVTAQAQPSDLSTTADRSLLTHALINLVYNGCEAALSHGPAPRVSVRAYRSPSGRLVVDVEDNGPGIPAGSERDVFLPFYTTKPTGSGVGLALVRQIVLAHRGSVQVERSALGGATMRLIL